MLLVNALLTPQDVARLLRVPVGTVRHMVRKELLDAIRLPNREIRFEQAALERFLEEHRQ